MSKLVVIEYVSLDGVIQGPGHSGEDLEGGFTQGGWTGPLMPDHRRYNTESFQTAGAFLLGRVTYEIWAAYWPTVTDERSEEHTSELQSPYDLVCRLLLEKKTKQYRIAA